jgi:transposase
MYAKEGRPSIPPEQLFSTLLLQALYSVWSERQLMEQIHYNLLFRWFCGLSPDAPVWDATTFTKNRERLQQSEVFEKFMTALLRHPKVAPLLSNEYFSVDGTLIEAWASHKSFKPNDGSGDGDDGENFHGQTRKNETPVSTTDPDRRLYRKAQGREVKLCYMGHALMENRNGLAVGGTVTLTNGMAEQRASEALLKQKAKETGTAATVGEDKAYDTKDPCRRATQARCDATCGAKQRQHQNRPPPPKRDRRPHIAAHRLRDVTDAAQDDRMPLRLGQTARHDAEDQAPRSRLRRRRLSPQPDRLQPDPHPETGRCIEGGVCPIP